MKTRNQRHLDRSFHISSGVGDTRRFLQGNFPVCIAARNARLARVRRLANRPTNVSETCMRETAWSGQLLAGGACADEIPRARHILSSPSVDMPLSPHNR